MGKCPQKLNCVTGWQVCPEQFCEKVSSEALELLGDSLDTLGHWRYEGRKQLEHTHSTVFLCELAGRAQ